MLVVRSVAFRRISNSESDRSGTCLTKGAVAMEADTNRCYWLHKTVVCTVAIALLLTVCQPALATSGQTGALTTRSLAAAVVELGCEATAYVYTGTDVKKAFNHDLVKKLASSDYRKFKPSEFKFVCGSKSVKIPSSLSKWDTVIPSRKFITYAERFGFSRQQFAGVIKGSAVRKNNFEFKTELLVNVAIRSKLRETLAGAVNSFTKDLDVLSEEAMECGSNTLGAPTVDELVDFVNNANGNDATYRYVERLSRRGLAAAENYLGLLKFLKLADYRDVSDADVNDFYDYFSSLKDAIFAHQGAIRQYRLIKRLNGEQRARLKAAIKALELNGSTEINSATIILLAREIGVDASVLGAAECVTERDLAVFKRLLEEQIDLIGWVPNIDYEQ